MRLVQSPAVMSPQIRAKRGDTTAAHWVLMCATVSTVTHMIVTGSAMIESQGRKKRSGECLRGWKVDVARFVHLLLECRPAVAGRRGRVHVLIGDPSRGHPPYL